MVLEFAVDRRVVLFRWQHGAQRRVVLYVADMELEPAGQRWWC